MAKKDRDKNLSVPDYDNNLGFNRFIEKYALDYIL